jgi:hypothetical protein
MGAYILYHEVVLVPTAEPLLIFAAFFLLGLIPASRADDTTPFNFKDILRDWLGKDDDDDDDPKSNQVKKGQPRDNET